MLINMPCGALLSERLLPTQWFLTYNFILSINLLQLFRHLQCPIGAPVINDNNLVVISTVNKHMVEVKFG